MRYDAKDRIMSLSFKRSPEEEADVMLGWRRRSTKSASAWKGRNILLGSLLFGVIVGLAMEIYRRFVLLPLLGVAEVMPLNIILLQLLPFLIVLGALIFMIWRHGDRRQRQTLVDRLEPALYIDIDIFREGLRSAGGQMTLTMDWIAIRRIHTDANRIEFEGETLTTYIPLRAFKNRRAFADAASQFRTLRQDAMRKQEEIIADGKDTAGKVAPSAK